jgi:ABC-2 type transport system ATP-binding protein
MRQGTVWVPSRRVSDSVISVRGLRKRYGTHEAVKGIDLEVGQGEIFGLLGTNGAGKTTTIEILEGYRSRTAGEVSVLGIDPAQPTRAWRERVGLVLQESELDPVYTVRETVGMFARYFARPRDVDETITLVGLGENRTKRLGALSGGQKRRVDVALGLIGDPDLLFLDEPTTGFDPQARRDAWNMIRGLRDLGKTVVLTTHYMEEAQHLADRLAILRDGVVVGSGTPADLVDSTSTRSGTVIRFRLPDGVGADAVHAAVGSMPDRSGDEFVLRTEQAQHTLFVLTSWAEQAGVELQGIEVTRPTLDDVFLELTGGSDADA